MAFSVIRVFFLGITLVGLSHWFGRAIMQSMLPLYQCAITQFDSQIEIISLAIVQQHGQHFLQLDALLTKPFFIGMHYFVPQIAIPSSSRIPLDFVLQPVVIFLTLAMGWPARSYRDYVLRLVVGAPLILILMLLDSPLQFNYMLWDSVERIVQTTGKVERWLRNWSDFLNGGGLIMLSLTISIMTIGISNLLTEKNREPN